MAAAAVVVTVAVGVVIFTTTTGGRQSTSPVSHTSVQAGPGLPAPVPLPSNGSASGPRASGRAGSGPRASSLPIALATVTPAGGVPVGGTQAPTSAAPTSAAPTTPAGEATSCKATYSIVSSWAGGYQASVTVADSGASALNGWTVDLTLANGQSINSLWSGANSGTSGAVTVKNLSYDGAIASGGSTTFGFTANGDGSAAPTTVGCSGQ